MVTKHYIRKEISDYSSLPLTGVTNILYELQDNGELYRWDNVNNNYCLWNCFTGSTSNLYWTTGSTGNYSLKTINDSTIDATGNYALAEGADTLASGMFSHSEGWSSISSGEGSHAEGGSTLFSNGPTVASGHGSHAEGISTSATTAGSHSEGGFTLASGNFSHAEGQTTIAYGTNSHSQNSITQAIGNYSHAGGLNSIASGDTSFIHSQNSIVTGNRSVVLGGQNITGATDDTIYVPNLNIGIVSSASTASTVTSIGVDESGTVVKSTSGNNYRVYTILFNQTGSTNPNVIELENSLGVSVTWTRSGVGSYLGTLSFPLITDKTIIPPFSTDFNSGVAGIFLPISVNGNPQTGWWNVWLEGTGWPITWDTIRVDTYDMAGQEEFSIVLGSKTPIEIKVYN